MHKRSVFTGIFILVISISGIATGSEVESVDEYVQLLNEYHEAVRAYETARQQVEEQSDIKPWENDSEFETRVEETVAEETQDEAAAVEAVYERVRSVRYIVPQQSIEFTVEDFNRQANHFPVSFEFEVPQESEHLVEFDGARTVEGTITYPIDRDNIAEEYQDFVDLVESDNIDLKIEVELHYTPSTETLRAPRYEVTLIDSTHQGRMASEGVFITPDDFAVFGADLARTGAYATYGPSVSAETHFVFETEGEITSSPVVSGDTVYVGSSDGTLYAIDTSTGNERWSYEPDQSYGFEQSSPAVASGSVFIGTAGRQVVSINAETGEQQWSHNVIGPIHSSPAVAGGIVYILDGNGTLLAFDAQTGEQQWSEPSESYVAANEGTSSPAVVDHTVYLGSPRGDLRALDLETGEEIWSFDTGRNAPLASPAVANGTVYIGGFGRYVFGVDAQSGEQQWAFDTRSFEGAGFSSPSSWGATASSPAVADGTVYIGNNDNQLYALDAQTGEERWGFVTENDIQSSPAVADGTVYVGSNDNHLYAIDAETGSELWSFETGGEIGWSSPTVADGVVYVGSTDNRLYAITGE